VGGRFLGVVAVAAHAEAAARHRAKRGLGVHARVARLAGFGQCIGVKSYNLAWGSAAVKPGFARKNRSVGRTAGSFATKRPEHDCY
jgi:hypothetical protein